MSNFYTFGQLSSRHGVRPILRGTSSSLSARGLSKKGYNERHLAARLRDGFSDNLPSNQNRSQSQSLDNPVFL